MHRTIVDVVKLLHDEDRDGLEKVLGPQMSFGFPFGTGNHDEQGVARSMYVDDDPTAVQSPGTGVTNGACFQYFWDLRAAGSSGRVQVDSW